MKATLALALLAAPGGFHEAKALEPAASYVAHKPVVVWCADSTASWHAFMLATYSGVDNGANGSTSPTTGDISLSALVCSALTVRYPVPLVTFGPSIEALTHEAIHARGESDEGITDCGAVHEMPGVATRFFHVKPYKPLRALMAAVWAWRATEPPAYRTVC